MHLTARAVHRLQSHAGGNPLTRARCSTSCPPTPGTARTICPPRARSPRSSSAGRTPARPARRALLEGVAILGPHGLLATAAELADVDEPLDALEEAVSAGLLRVDERRGVPAPAFAHPLIAAAVYERSARRGAPGCTPAPPSWPRTRRRAAALRRPRRARTMSSRPGSRRSPSARRRGTRCSRQRWPWSPRRA